MREPGTATRASASRLGYQPALDGLRAVSIVLVMCFHYSFRGRPLVKGGFLGVDAFFTLSGFLITVLLLQERARTGSIGLRHFYARRALRLLPAAMTLVAFAVVLRLLPAEFSGKPSWSGILGTTFYVANWVRIVSPESMGILGPTWSLSIEEQFYLLWPLLLLGMLALGWRRRHILLATLGLTAASAAWCAILWNRSVTERGPTFLDYYLSLTNRGRSDFAYRLDAWDRIYFGSDTRAAGLLLGCCLAIALTAGADRLTPTGRRLLTLGSFLGAAVCVLIVATSEAVRSGWLFDWGMLPFSLPVVGIIAGLMVAPRSPLGKVLGIGLLVWIGRRSYGLYLFHVPVFVLLPEVTDLSEWPGLVASFGLVFVIAALSYRFLEQPILRRRTHFPGAV